MTVQTSITPLMETNTLFTEFELKDELIQTLTNLGFKNASPVQEVTIAPVLEGKDIFAQAETGSGKTGAFAIPLVEKILRDREQQKEDSEDDSEEGPRIVRYIVMSPTRELAQQTHSFITQLAENLDIRATCLIGGESFEKQKELLAKRPEILVATPGRLCDLINQKLVKVDRAQAIVFDEADRLFDMGFKKDIEYVLRQVPKERQLIMVSATNNMDVIRTAYKFHSDPVEIKLNTEDLLVENIDHKIAMISREEKMPLLVNLLRQHEDAYALVFCNTQVQTHLVAAWLDAMGFKAEPISGRLAQSKRTKLMERFRSRDITILVCTDVAARGLDIKDVNLVVNYDLPQEAANYVHRIGRTGRAGKEGHAISFCSHEDCEYLDDIYEYIGDRIPKMELTDDDFAKDVCPRPYIDYKTLKVKERPDKRGAKGQTKGQKDRRPEKTNKSKGPMNETQQTEQDQKKPTPQQPKEHKLGKKMDPVEFPPFVANEDQEGDKRVFIHTAPSREQAERAALGYFRITDKELLNVEIQTLGKKKFFFFGPQETTYRITLEPHYKRLILPFVIEIIKLSRMRLFAKVHYKNNTVHVTFDGPDQGLLLTNRQELLHAFEHLIRKFLGARIELPRDLRFEITAKDAGQNSTRDTSRNGRRNSRKEGKNKGAGKSEEAQEQDIIQMAEKMKQRVLQNQEAVLLNPLNPKERRLVHQHLGEDDEVKTESKGDGHYKRIEISLR